ncbi:ABC transporter ATP-binding protein [Haloglycomyces albus]|uniref:ABC transporter ATP-binding protein n=1 Tax=Haloglycomyces albus TaxID=526067 RepID=UPI00046CF561|nr:sn-glycerol-3-phosphate ABC transporter ATP-binding protein UgpC [Haloglycomyces albus]
MATVSYKGASRLYPGSDVPAVDQLDLEIEAGEFLVLVGPSGCGKSTSLRMLAGLEEVTSGSIWIDDTDVTHMEPKERDIAMVFQNYALYPHMSVFDNMGFALKLKRTPKNVIRERVTEAAKLLDLTEYLDRKPKALSGGQRQRVAMGRAIVREPQVFLMDEPLSNLDAKLRVQTRSQIASLQQRLGITTVYVTHDQVEAMTMGHRIAVLKDGLLQQCETPRVLYEKPENLFVAGFIGSPAMNLVTVPFDEDGARFGGTSLPMTPEMRRRVEQDSDKSVTVGIRPEHCHLSEQPGDGFEMEVELVEELGSEAFVYGKPTSSEGSAGAALESERFTVRCDPHRVPRLGQTIHIVPEAGREHLFSATDGHRLN